MATEQEVYDSIEFRGEDGWIGKNYVDYDLGNDFVLEVDEDGKPCVVDVAGRREDHSEEIDELLADHLPKLRHRGVERSEREDHLYYLHVVECDGKEISFDE